MEQAGYPISNQNAGPNYIRCVSIWATLMAVALLYYMTMNHPEVRVGNIYKMHEYLT